MQFDITRYAQDNSDKYGDAPLDDVAQDVYTQNGFDKDPAYKSFEDWKEKVNIKSIVDEDLSRRSSLDESRNSSPGILEEMGRAVGRSVTQDIPQMAGKAMQWMGGDEGLVHSAGQSLEEMGKENAKRFPSLAPSKEFEEAPFYSPRSFLPAAAGMLPVIGASMATGFLVSGAAGAAGVGAGVAGAAGSIASVLPFYGSTAEDEYRNAKEKGLSDEDAKEVANITGIIMAGGMHVAKMIPAKLFGGLSKGAQDGILKAVTADMPISQIAKNTLKAMGTEALAFGAQSGAMTYAEQQYGLTDKSALEEAAKTIPMAMTLGLLFSAGGINYSNAKRADIRNTFSDPSSSPEKMGKAVNEVYEEARKVDPQFAEAFKQRAWGLYKAGHPVIFDSDTFYREDLMPKTYVKPDVPGQIGEDQKMIEGPPGDGTMPAVVPGGGGPMPPPEVVGPITGALKAAYDKAGTVSLEAQGVQVLAPGEGYVDQGTAQARMEQSEAAAKLREDLHREWSRRLIEESKNEVAKTETPADITPPEAQVGDVSQDGQGENLPADEGIAPVEQAAMVPGEIDKERIVGGPSALEAGEQGRAPGEVSAETPTPVETEGLVPEEKAGEPPAVEGKKEPWQMTRDEYKESGLEHENLTKAYENAPVIGGQKHPSQVDYGHYWLVKAALDEGKAVPPEVLAEYPALKKPEAETGNTEVVPENKVETPAENQGYGKRPAVPDGHLLTRAEYVKKIATDELPTYKSLVEKHKANAAKGIQEGGMYGNATDRIKDAKALVNKTQRAIITGRDSEYEGLHRGQIKQALKDGVEVPDNVLADYPDIKRPEAKTPEPTAGEVPSGWAKKENINPRVLTWEKDGTKRSVQKIEGGKYMVFDKQMDLGKEFDTLKEAIDYADKWVYQEPLEPGTKVTDGKRTGEIYHNYEENLVMVQPSEEGAAPEPWDENWVPEKIKKIIGGPEAKSGPVPLPEKVPFQIGDMVVPKKGTGMDFIKNPVRINHIDSNGSIKVEGHGAAHWNPDDFDLVPKVNERDEALESEAAVPEKTNKDLLSEKIAEGRHGMPVLIPELRSEFPDMSKEDFDKAIVDLSKDGTHFLAKHFNPAQSTDAEKENMVPDGEGGYYVAINAKEKEPGETTDTEAADTGRDVGTDTEGKKRKKKLVDVGEQMFGKTSAKDHRTFVEKIVLDLDLDFATKNPAAVVRALFSATAKSSLFKISPAEGATPGVSRVLDQIRSKFKGFKDYYMSREWKVYDWEKEIDNRQATIKRHASEYISAMTILNDTLNGFSTVDEVKRSFMAMYSDMTEDGDRFSTILQRMTTSPGWSALREMGDGKWFDPYIEDEMNATRNLPLRRERVDLESLEMPGPKRDGKDIPAEKLLDVFGLRGAEFGEWANALHRQLSTNFTFDSFHDLADILNAPLWGISLNSKQRLGIAFGSRGNKVTWAAAHYEPDSDVINLTKTCGDGSLAHEWGHAFDFMTKSGMVIDYDGGNANVVKDLKDAMQYTYDTSTMAKDVEIILRGAMKSGKGIKGDERVGAAKRFLEGWENRYRVKTQFYKNSIGLDGGTVGEYYSDPVEMWARGFEAFVADKLQGTNMYLVSKNFVAPGGVEALFNRDFGAYPSAEERERFKGLYQDLFDGLEWSDDGIPKVKEGYELVTAKEKRLIGKTVTDLAEKLQAIFDGMFKGEQSEDGLFWYAYQDMQRGVKMQPDGFMGYNDDFDVKSLDGSDNFTGQGSVGYGSQLSAADVIDYGLISIVHTATDKTVYLEAGDDTTFGVGIGSEAELGTSSAGDGEISEEEGDVPEHPPGSGDESGEGIRGIDTSGESQFGTGEGDSGESLDTSAFGGGDENATELAIPSTAGNYLLTSEDIPTKTSVDKHFNNAISALRLLKTLEKENRLATKVEQAVLAKMPGWGTLADALDYNPKDAWESRAQILASELTLDELRSARDATTTSYLTPIEALDFIYKGAQKLGFYGGRMLEPALGLGHFFGAMPENMRPSSTFTGIEKDGLMALFAKHLYQNSSILNSPYEKVSMPPDFFDFSATNVPFLNQAPFDADHNPHKFNLHDYYILKSLALTRPGGLSIMLTSSGTMDKADQSARKEISAIADFLGGVRLPSNFFNDTKSSVTTDILFFRRKSGEATKVPALDWIETDRVIGGENRWGNQFSAPANKYFVDHPEMVIGELQVKMGGRYGDYPEISVVGGLDELESRLEEALKNLPSGAYLEPGTIKSQDILDVLSKPEEVKDKSYYISGGKLIRNIGGTPFEISVGKLKDGKPSPADLRTVEVLKKFIGLRTTIRETLRAMAKEETPGDIQKFQAKLNKQYDAFVKAHGYLNSTPNLRAMSGDPDVGSVLGLEKWDADHEKGIKTAIFTQNVIEKAVPPESVDKSSEALVVSTNYKGRIDLAYMSKLTGFSQEKIISDLSGEIFNDPMSGWVHADDYLSGHIRDKIKIAEQAAKSDKKYEKNIEALKAVIPPEIPYHKISVKQLGGSWITGDLYSDFSAHLMGGDVRGLIVSRSGMGVWDVSFAGKYNRSTGEPNKADAIRKKSDAYSRYEAHARWGTDTDKGNFFTLLSHLLNGTSPKIYVTETDQNGRVVNALNPVTNKPIIDMARTNAAIMKMNEIKEAFATWLWKDTYRRKELSDKFNITLNSVVRQRRDGSSLPLPGKVPDSIITLLPHQNSQVRMFIKNGVMYLANDVGTGKTFTMVASIMETKRLGFYKRPVLLVNKDTLSQIQASFYRLYPGANVLAIAMPEDAAKRTTELKRITSGNWDCVLMTHESFEKIPVSADMQRNFLDEERRRLVISLGQMREGKASSKLVKDVSRRIQNLTTKIEELQSKEKDDIPCFDELGIDLIVADEAHKYKNLPIQTVKTNISGLNVEGSDIAFDMFMKTQYLHKTYGKGIIFASGTPLTNSVGELYSISRYLQPKELVKRGIESFDIWANTFGNIGQATQYAPEGGGFKTVTKFKSFENIPELMQMITQCMSIVKFEDTGMKRPPIVGGKPVAVTVPLGDLSGRLAASIQNRAVAYRNDPAGRAPDNMLSIINDGRNAAMDPRLYNSHLPDIPETKTNYAVPIILEHYKAEYDAEDDDGKAYKEKKGVQLIFCDRGTPGKNKKFTIYDDLKAKLVAGGIPAKEIAFIHDATNDKAKAELLKKIQTGEVRVAVGSTEKLGTGVNVQDRGVAIHNLDIGWTFESLEQRLGRFLRYGNRIKEVAVYNYGTEKTVDAFMWDTVSAKGKVIGQVLVNDPIARSAEDIALDPKTMSSDDMVAAFSSDPMVKEKKELEDKIATMRSARSGFERLRNENQQIYARLPAKLEGFKTLKAQNDKVSAVLEPIDAVRISGVDGVLVLKKDGGKANDAITRFSKDKKVLADALASYKKNEQVVLKVIGKYGVSRTEERKYITKDDKGKDVEKTEKVVHFDPTDTRLIVVFGPDLTTAKTGLVMKATNILVRTGADGVGSRSSIDAGASRSLTTLKSAIEEETAQFDAEIARIEKEMPQIRADIDLPFKYEKELAEAQTRLAVVNSELIAQQEINAVRIAERTAAAAQEVSTDNVEYEIDINYRPVIPEGPPGLYYVKNEDGSYTRLDQATPFVNEAIPWVDWFVVRHKDPTGKAKGGGFAVFDRTSGFAVAWDKKKQDVLDKAADLAMKLGEADWNTKVNQIVEANGLTPAFLNVGKEGPEDDSLVRSESGTIFKTESVQGWHWPVPGSAMGEDGTFFKTEPKQIEDKTGPNLKAADVRAEFKDVINKSIFTRIEVVNTPAGISDKKLREETEKYEKDTGRVVKALYHEPSNTIYIFANRHKTMPEAAKSIVHELFGHRGFYKSMGKDLNGFLDFMAAHEKYGKMVNETADRLGFDMGSDEGRRTAAKETFAEQAESGTVEPTLWSRFIVALKNFLAKLGFKGPWINSFDDNDFAEMIRKAKKAAFEEGPAAEKPSEKKPAPEPETTKKDIETSFKVKATGLPRELVEELERLHKGIDATIFTEGDKINLASIQVRKALQGKELGSRFMEVLTDYADSVGKPIVLAARGDLGGDEEGQKRFYRRHGFVDNPDKKAYENMVRMPKVQTFYATGPGTGSGPQNYARFVQQGKKHLAKMADGGINAIKGLEELVMPTAVSDDHYDAAVVLGSKLGGADRMATVSRVALRPFWVGFNKMGVSNKNVPLEDNFGIVVASALSTGDDLPARFTSNTQFFEDFRDVYLKEMKKMTDAHEEAGVPIELMEHYFPGIWTPQSRRAFNQAVHELHPDGTDIFALPAAGRRAIRDRVDQLLESGDGMDGEMDYSYFSRRPLKGKESFRKQKVFRDDFMDAIEFGLKPISNNPADLIAIKLKEMGESLLVNQALKEYRADGTVRDIKYNEKMPAGFFKINDKYGTIYGPPVVPVWKLLKELAKTAKKDLYFANFGQEVFGDDTLKEELNKLEWSDGQGRTFGIHQMHMGTGRSYSELIIENLLNDHDEFESRAPRIYQKLQDISNNSEKLKSILSTPTFEDMKQKFPVGGFVIQGYRVASKGVSDILNNYLSQSLYNNKYFGRPFAMYMRVGNVLNQVQLGLFSLFHAGFEIGETGITSLANNIGDLYGLMIGTRTMDQFTSGLLHTLQSPWLNAQLGTNILREYEVPGTGDAHTQMMAKAVELGGGRAYVEEAFQTNARDEMMRFYFSGEKLKAALKSPEAFVELSSAPLMNWFVPALKMAAFSEKVDRLIMDNPRLQGETEDEHLFRLRGKLRQTWGFVDGSMGQVNYRRLFVNNTAKNVVQAVMRAPGWTGGTIVNILGGLKDTFGFFKDWALNKKAPNKIPDRVAYTIALLAGAALLNGILTKMLSGKDPEGMDWWAFRTGNKDEYGRDERYVLPSYTKDIMAYYKDPTQTLLNKTHPLINLISSLVQNKDYYGTEIRNEDDTLINQGLDLARYGISQFTPFWMRGVGKAMDRDASLAQTAAPLIGIMPAPAYFNKTEAELLMSDYLAEHRVIGGRTKEQAARTTLVRDITRKFVTNKPKEGADMIRDAVQKGQLSKNDIKTITRNVQTPPTIRAFKRLSSREALRVWAVTTSEEKKTLRPFMVKKQEALKNGPPMEFKEINDKFVAALKQQ